MQVQAPPTYAPTGTPGPGGNLFNAFYEATSPIAFDFASGLTARPNDAAAIVAAAYENVGRAHDMTGAPYHAVPLLAEIYSASASYRRPPTGAVRPGAEAVGALGEPHRSILHLMERHKFSAENTGAILGLDSGEVVEAHEDARAVAHGVSAALALCPGGMASCPALAAELDPGVGVVPQTEKILDHAERCDLCMATALASPDPIRELRHFGPAPASSGPMPAAPMPMPPFAAGPGPGPQNGNGVPVNGSAGPGLGAVALGAAAVPAAAAAVWSAAPAGASPLPGPAPGPSLAAKVPPKEKSWSPLRLWNKATGWQKSGAIMAVLMIAALAVAIAAGGDGEDVAARTNNSSTSPQSSSPNGKAPIPAFPSPNNGSSSTPDPMTTAPSGGEAPSYSTSDSGSSGSSSSGYASSTSTSSGDSSGYSSGSSSGQVTTDGGTVTTSPPPETTQPPATAPPGPHITGDPAVSTGRNVRAAPAGQPAGLLADFDVDYATNGTSITYQTSWGTSGNLLSGSGTIHLEGVPLSFTQDRTISVAVYGADGSVGQPQVITITHAL